MTPTVAIHLTAIVAATVIGPVALWARKGSRGHRAAGYAWVTLMLVAATSSLFIRHPGSGWHGYSWIHLLSLGVFFLLGRSIWSVAHGRIREHRRTMQGTYIGASLVAGAFALSPHRMLGTLVWGQMLGWI